MTSHDTQPRLADFDAPEDALVERAIERIGNPQHRSFFYGRLENPLWVSPLARHGAFAEVPSSAVDDNGGVRFEAWPQGEYLARMADLVPKEVASVLVQSQFSSTDNPIVHRALIEAASRMPAAQARLLTDTICKYLAGPHRRYILPEPLVDLVVLLADGNLSNPANKLAQAIYRPGGRDGGGKGAGLDPYFYAQSLPRVVSAFKSDPKALNMVAAWLDLWCESDALDPHMRSMWRNSIHERQPDGYERMTYQVGHALVDAVSDLARARIDADASVLDILAIYGKGRNPIFFRLALDALSHAVTRRFASARDARELHANAAENVIATALEWLTNPKLLAGEYRAEYSRLARAVLPHLSEGQLEQWQHLIAHPPHLTADRVARRLGTGENEISIEQIETYIGRWERDLLAEISTLPARLEDRLSELTGTYGQPPAFGRIPPHESPFIADTSPLGDAELAELGPEALVAYAVSWEPTPTAGFGDPSPEGLARSISRVVAANPAPYAQQAGRFSSLGPRYVGALLDGLREAIGQQRVFPWGPVLALVADCASRRDHEQDDADASWRFTLQQAADLVRLGLNPQSGAIERELYEAAWAALEPITRSPHPTREEERTFGPPSTDALTSSLNFTRPVALRAAIRLLLSARQEQIEHNEPDDTNSTGRAVASAVLTALDEHVGPGKDESLTAAAVFGEGLGTLLTAAPEWTLARLERLLGPSDAPPATEADQAWFETAWTVMLVGYRPSLGLFEPLERWFMAHLTDLANERAEPAATFGMRSPRQALGDHVLMLFVTGQLEGGLGNRALGALFEFGDTALTRNALGHLGWAVRQSSGEIPATVLARFRDLWDWRRQQVDSGNARRQELLDFYWWVSSSQFDAGWWLPRLLFVVQDPEFNSHGSLGEPLAQAAPTHPGEVLDVFTALHENGLTLTSYDLLNHAPAILAPAVASPDAELSGRARTLADQLGREGFVDLMERIETLAGQPRA